MRNKRQRPFISTTHSEVGTKLRLDFSPLLSVIPFHSTTDCSVLLQRSRNDLRQRIKGFLKRKGRWSLALSLGKSQLGSGPCRYGLSSVIRSSLLILSLSKQVIRSVPLYEEFVSEPG